MMRNSPLNVGQKKLTSSSSSNSAIHQNQLCSNVLAALDSVLSENRDGRFDTLVSPATWSPFVPDVLGCLLVMEKWLLNLGKTESAEGEEGEEGEEEEEEEKDSEDEESSFRPVRLYHSGRLRELREIDSTVLGIVSHMLRKCSNTALVVPAMNGDERLRGIFDVHAGAVDCILVPFQSSRDSDVLGGVVLVSNSVRSLPMSLAQLPMFLRVALKGVACTSSDGGRSLLQNDAVTPFRMPSRTSSRLLKRATSESAIKRSSPLPFDERRAAIVTVSTVDGRIIDWDETAVNMFGWTPLEVVGKPLSSVLLPEPFNAMDQWLFSGAPAGADNTFSGGVSRCVATLHKSGTILQTRVSFGDITQGDSAHRIVLLELDSSVVAHSLGLPFKSSSLLHSGVALLLASSSGTICFANCAAENLFKLPSNELVGSAVSSVICGGAAIAFDKLFRGHQEESGVALSPVRRGGTAFEIAAATINQREVIPAKRRKNEQFPVHVSVGHVRSESRTLVVLCFHELTRDVDKLKLELENKTLRREINRLYKTPIESDIGSGSSHDIQTPLDQVIESLRVVSRSIFLAGDECSLLWGAISALSQGGAKLLQPVMQEPARTADLDITTRRWLVQQMGLSMSCLINSGEEVGEEGGADEPSSLSRDVSNVDSRDQVDYSIPNTPERTRVLEIMRNADMGLDCFELEAATGCHALTTIVIFALESYGLLAEMRLNTSEKMRTLRTFLSTVARGYNQDIPYHNATHAADVVYTCFCLLSSSGAARLLSPMEKFSLIIACAIHDVDHRGTNNNYQVNACEDLALTYNDRSVMENHHVASAFKILARPECRFTSHFSAADFRKFRSLVIDLVLITDMTQHFSFVSNIKGVLASLSSSQSEEGTTPNISSPGSVSAQKKECLFLPEHACLIAQAIVKLSDLGHTIKPLDLHKKWSALIQEEFFQQGDKEKKGHLPPSPFMDREKDDPIRSQVGFFEFVVIPFTNLLSEALDLPSWVRENAEQNHHFWRMQLKSEGTSPPSSK